MRPVVRTDPHALHRPPLPIRQIVHRGPGKERQHLPGRIGMREVVDLRQQPRRIRGDPRLQRHRNIHQPTHHPATPSHSGKPRHPEPTSAHIVETVPRQRNPEPANQGPRYPIGRHIPYLRPRPVVRDRSGVSLAPAHFRIRVMGPRTDKGSPRRGNPFRGGHHRNPALRRGPGAPVPRFDVEDVLRRALRSRPSSCRRGQRAGAASATECRMTIGVALKCDYAVRRD